jgi:hypothetical protein
MNRRKKINQILGKKAKKANLKANPSHKPRYISKAERARTQASEDGLSVADSDSVAVVDAAAE